MAGARKRWRITYLGLEGTDAFTSEKQTYQFVQHLGRSYAANPDGMARHLTVWVAERDGEGWGGWQRYEELDLTELAPQSAAS